jgi:hypothetical protein
VECARGIGENKCLSTFQFHKDGVPVAMARSCSDEMDLVVVAIANQSSLILLDVSQASESNMITVVSSLTLTHNSKPSNMCFYENGKKLLVQVDQAPHVLVYEKSSDNTFQLSASTTLSARVASVVQVSFPFFFALAFLFSLSPF